MNSIFEKKYRDVLIRFLTTLISFFADSATMFIAFFADFANVIIANFVPIQITTLMIDFIIMFDLNFVFDEYFENLNDVIVRKKQRKRQFEQKMRNHEQSRVSNDSSVRDLFFTRDSIFSRTRASIFFCIVVALIFSRTSRIFDRRQIVVKIEVDETFTVVESDNDENEESMNENDEEFSDCVKCCCLFVSCRRIVDIACARCVRQKQTCISIRFRFVMQMIFFNYIKFQFDLEKLRSN